MRKPSNKTFFKLQEIVLLAAFVGALGNTGCVSVQLGGTKAKRSQSVNFRVPTGAFLVIQDPVSDQAWQSSKTGNTISFLSECPQPDASLENITDEFLSAFGKAKNVTKTNAYFNGRESLSSTADGLVDGVEMKMESIAFRKNGCAYVISYVGRATKYQQEHSDFEQFLKDFKVL